MVNLVSATRYPDKFNKDLARWIPVSVMNTVQAVEKQVMQKLGRDLQVKIERRT